MKQGDQLIKSKSADIWAAGIVIHKIIYGIFPHWAEIFQKAVKLATLSGRLKDIAKTVADVETIEHGQHLLFAKVNEATRHLCQIDVNSMVKLPASLQQNSDAVQLVKKMNDITAELDAILVKWDDLMAEEQIPVNWGVMSAKVDQFVDNLLLFGEETVKALDSQPKPADPLDQMIYGMLRVSPEERVLSYPYKLI
jgi:hypothetical protein